MTPETVVRLRELAQRAIAEPPCFCWPKAAMGHQFSSLLGRYLLDGHAYDPAEQYTIPVDSQTVLALLDAADAGGRLREALEAIRDMEPEPVDESVPDHSECAECKRKQSLNLPPGMQMCDALYRALRDRDHRWENAERGQQFRMRDIARVALAGTPPPATRNEVCLTRDLYEAICRNAELGAAWARVEAALPKGWAIQLTVNYEWCSIHYWQSGDKANTSQFITERTPTTALLALATKLEASTEEDGRG